MMLSISVNIILPTLFPHRVRALFHSPSIYSLYTTLSSLLLIPLCGGGCGGDAVVPLTVQLVRLIHSFIDDHDDHDGAAAASQCESTTREIVNGPAPNVEDGHFK